MTCFSYIIPKITESQNVYQRWHHMVRNREKNAWIHQIMARRVLSHHCPPFTARTVSITSFRPRLITDHGNLVGGAKSVPDALVHCDLLVDDSDKWASIEYFQALTRDSPLVGNRIFRGVMKIGVPIPCTKIVITDMP